MSECLDAPSDLGTIPTPRGAQRFSFSLSRGIVDLYHLL